MVVAKASGATGVLPHDLLVKNVGSIPNGSGWRFVGRLRGELNASATLGQGAASTTTPVLGHAFVHTVLDDHSRAAYFEIHNAQNAATAAAGLRRATAWFGPWGLHRAGLDRQRRLLQVPSLQQTCAELGLAAQYTWPCRPKSNGKNGFQRTGADPGDEAD